MKTYLYILIALLTLASCSENKEATLLFAQVETLIDEHPDSALTLLDCAHTSALSYPRSQRMRYELLRAKAQNKAYVDFTTDSVMMEVVEYYDSHGTANEQVEAHYLLGCTYRDMHEAPMALSCYLDAVEKADTLSEDCDYGLLMRVYGQIAKGYEGQLLPEEAIKAWKQYCSCALRDGNVYNYIQGKELQISTYCLMGDTIKALSLNKTVHDLYTKHGFIHEAAQSWYHAIYLYLDQKKYSEAHKLMEIYEKESGLFDRNGNIETGKGHYYDAKGLYYSGVNQTDSAKLFFHKALQHSKSFAFYRGLMGVYQQEKNFDSAMHYMTKYEDELETSLAEIQTQATIHAKGMYDYARNQQMAEQKRRLAERNRNIIYVMALAFVIAAAVSFVAYSRYKSKKRMELETLNMKFLKASQLHETVKRDLTMIGEDFSDFKAAKEKELALLHQQLTQINLQYNNLKHKDKLDALRNSSVFKAVKDKLDPRQKNNLILDKEWEELLLLVSQCMPAFYSYITKDRSLSKQELQVTILTKLSFSTNDISLLLDRPAQRVTNAKATANTKLFGDCSARTFSVNLETS